MTYELNLLLCLFFVCRANRAQDYGLSGMAINDIYSYLTFQVKADKDCEKNYLLILVKSAPQYFEKREAIRATWGDINYLSNVSQTVGNTGKSIKLVFFVGSSSTEDLEQESALEREFAQYGDLSRPEFIDNYDNNTFKIMSTMFWAMEYCPDFEFAIFVDDDMFLNVNNLLHFLRSPETYPEVLKPNTATSSIHTLYAGKVIHTSPVRNKLGMYLTVDTKLSCNYNLYGII